MAVKTYSYKNNKDTKLSDHFTVKEFASISGSKLYTDTVLIDTDLVNKLEKLYRAMNCSKIIINSGYRCPRLNDLVKGSKTSQHLTGEAADIRSTSDSIKDNKELFDVIKTLIKEKKIEVGQLINEYNYNWVHVSLPNKKHKNEILAIK